MITLPAEYEGDVRRGLHTMLRDVDLFDRFDRLVEDGATWDEAAYAFRTCRHEDMTRQLAGAYA